jgi:hypothetical protein
MLRDLLHSVSAARALSPVSGGANDTASVSEIIDTQGYSGVLFVTALGSIADADATFTALVEHGDVSNLSDAAAVPDNQLISMTAGTAPETAASFAFDSDNGVRLIDYTAGIKRYVRLTLTPANNTGAWLHSVVALKYGARHNPAGVTQAP